MEERLQRFISRSGIASRRDAEKLIVDNKVKVNGKIVNVLGSKVNPLKDRVSVNGKKISLQDKKYYLFNKPRGIVTTMSDPKGRKSISDFTKNIDVKVFPVGRLDYNTEGLLLLTNDGDLAYSLTHPKFEVKKTYEAYVLGIVSEEKLDKLRVGVKLEDGVTAPAHVILKEYNKDKNTSLFEITIHEGKNRQVRRMCDAIGHPVRNLKRIKFANLTISLLKQGSIRELTAKEVEKLYALVNKHENI